MIGNFEMNNSALIWTPSADWINQVGKLYQHMKTSKQALPVDNYATTSNWQPENYNFNDSSTI